MRILLSMLVALASMLLTVEANAQENKFDPPWNKPLNYGLNFTIKGIDNVPDLYGDITDPQLVIFFAGNQFMVVDDLLRSFKKAYPQYTRVFAETLPPGILAKQILSGSVTIGNMTISYKPDVYTAGKSAIAETPDWFSRTEAYTKNKLAIMVQKGNPKGIKGLSDLGKADVKIAMPNPAWEGIGKQIEEAYVKAGGEALKNRIMVDKVKDQSTYLTQIHHRQTAMRILYGESEVGPVWYSEVHYQKMLGHPIDLVEIPDKENMEVTYVAGQLKTAPHAQAAKDFMDFMITETAKEIYRKYGFTTQ